MLDVAVAYNRYRFLGLEFLTWLWFTIETDGIPPDQGDLPSGRLRVGNRMVLENRRENRVETIRISGDQAGLEEAMVALNKGAMVAELNLVFQSDALKWQFTLKGESLGISGFKLPELRTVQDGADDGLVEKIEQIETVAQLVPALFHRFIQLRLSDQWDAGHRGRFRAWLSSSMTDQQIVDNPADMNNTGDAADNRKGY